MKTKRCVLCLFLAMAIPCQSAQAKSLDDPLPKSRNKAFLKSLLPTIGLTGGGIAMMACASIDDGHDMTGWAGFWMTMTGMIVAPSLGQLYAERPKPFSGAALRTGLGFLWVDGIFAASLNNMSTCTVNDNNNAAIALTVIGGGGIMASAIYDIVTAPRSVDRLNERVHSFSLDLSPAYYSQQKAHGIAIRIGF